VIRPADPSDFRPDHSRSRSRIITGLSISPSRTSDAALDQALDATVGVPLAYPTRGDVNEGHQVRKDAAEG